MSFKEEIAQIGMVRILPLTPLLFPGHSDGRVGSVQCPCPSPRVLSGSSQCRQSGVDRIAGVTCGRLMASADGEHNPIC